MCKEVALAGQGVYVRADNTNSAYRAVASELDTMAKTDITSTVFAEYNEQFQSFAILALLLLVIEYFVLERINKRLNRLKIFDLKEKI